MENHRVTVVPATLEAVAPYGYFVGAHGNVKKFASWPGTDVFGSFPITVGDGGEMLLVQMAPRIFPVVPSLIERHFKHSQTYLPFNGKPFIMLLGEPTDGDLPNYATLRAFLFDDSSGIILHADVWHDFPYALEPDTQFAVILREEAHVNVNLTPTHEFDADGPDLQRRGLKSRATITVELSDAQRRKQSL
jgi:ureidoglycolate lyase